MLVSSMGFDLHGLETHELVFFEFGRLLYRQEEAASSDIMR